MCIYLPITLIHYFLLEHSYHTILHVCGPFIIAILPTEIDAIRAGQKAEKERRKREKTAIVGDVHPMMHALPTLEELLNSSKLKADNQKLKKSKGSLKQKEAKKEL